MSDGYKSDPLYEGVLKSLERIANKGVVQHIGSPFPSRFERTLYSDLYLMSMVSEIAVQQDIIATLHTYRVDAIAIDSGLKRARGRFFQAALERGIDAREIVKFNAGGIPAGLCDLHATLAPEGIGLFIEVKAPAWIDERKKVIREAGKPTEEQVGFLLSKHERGAIALVAWSVDDVTRVLGERLMKNFNALGNV